MIYLKCKCWPEKVFVMAISAENARKAVKLLKEHHPEMEVLEAVNFKDVSREE